MIQLALDLAQKTCHLAQKLLFPRKYVVAAIVARQGSRSYPNRLPAVGGGVGGNGRMGWIEREPHSALGQPLALKFFAKFEPDLQVSTATLADPFQVPPVSQAKPSRHADRRK